MISTIRSSWRPIGSVVPQVWILVPMVFGIFLIDLDGGPECTLSNFAGNTNLGKVVDTPDRFVAI